MAKLINILIIDDELQSRSLIKKFLQSAGHEENVFEAGSVAEALQKINSVNPALVFLDVQMKGETGFDMLDKIPRISFEVIFTTAHTEYAIKAFRYSAIDYLVKPLDPDEFNHSLSKALDRIENQQPNQSKQLQFLQQQVKAGNKLPEKLIIPSLDGYQFVEISDIIYCHAVNNYTEFFMPGNPKILSSHTLGYYDEWLSVHNFFRIHRSYLVNLAHIKMYKRGDGGSVIMSNGDEIEVSRNNKEGFLKLFKV